MPRATWMIAVLFLLFTALATAQTSSTTASPVPGAAVRAPAFDVNAAVETYLAKMSPAQRRDLQLISKGAIGSPCGIFLPVL